MLLLSRFKISGHSMEPTLLHGQTILVSNISYLFSKPKINDIVALRERKSGIVFIKRIVKVDGEKYFVSGDNKKDSMDSKDFGWIEKGEIVGKVLFKLKV